MIERSPHPPAPSPGAAGEGETEERIGTLAPAVEGGEFGTFLQKPSPHIAKRARELRHSSTSAEQMLWQKLRGRQLCGRKFRRQHPVGRFIADFFCDDARLIIELDGAVHQEATQQERDASREEILRNSSLSLLRFTNEQVFSELGSVLYSISAFLRTQHHESNTPPSPAAPGEGGRGGEGK